MADTIRVALIGKTGVGKSALGNTLLGDYRFKSSIGGESETTTCASEVGKLPNGQLIKVVDTPGIMDTRGIERKVRSEVTKAIAHLSPGPHAFLIVLQPGRATTEERRVISELRGLFGDQNFLNYTVMVIVRKNDLRGKGNKPLEIHDYINNYAAKEVQELYHLCGKRVVAVENNASSDDELHKYALDVRNEIQKLGGKYYSHEYFQLMQKMKIEEAEIKKKDQEIKRLQAALEEKAKEDNNDFCTIL